MVFVDIPGERHAEIIEAKNWVIDNGLTANLYIVISHDENSTEIHELNVYSENFEGTFSRIVIFECIEKLLFRFGFSDENEAAHMKLAWG